MDSKILGIFSYSWPKGDENVSFQRRDVLALYKKAVWMKANPRGEEYMKELFLNRCPGGDYVNVDKYPLWHERILSAETVILLYPDAIGLGFRKIESQVFRRKRNWTSVRVINGRKREFPLTQSTHRRLYLRRFLESWMIAEVLATIFFLMITPILFVLDWMGGRR